MDKDSMATWVGIGVWFTCLIAWGTAVISDAANSRIGWLIADVLVAPIGLFRGLGMWLGLV